MITRIRVDRDDAGRPRVVARSAELAPRMLEHGRDRVRIALVATVALLLAGDDVTIEVDVAADVHVEIVETAAIVAYDMRGGSARWQVAARVVDGGTLVWNGLPIIVSDGADVERRTELELAPHAVARLRETVVLGRSGQRGGRLRLVTDVRRPDGGPVLCEHLTLGGDTLGADPDPVVLGAARVLDTVTILGARLPLDDRADVLQLAEPGTQVRYLGTHLHESPLAELLTPAAPQPLRDHLPTVAAAGL